MQFRYGYIGPSTNGFLVLQDKKGDRTTVISDHRISTNPEVETQYIGGVVLDNSNMTLFAEVQRPRKSDPEGTIRMKKVMLI